MCAAQRRDAVRWIFSVRFQDLVAGVEKVAFRSFGPTAGALQAHVPRQAGDIGLLEGEAGQGRLQIRWRGVGAPPGGAIDDGAAAPEEDLLQSGPFPEAIRSRMPESQARF